MLRIIFLGVVAVVVAIVAPISVQGSAGRCNVRLGLLGKGYDRRASARR